jgi:isopenicillin N synthase-like dioxygenase
MASANRDGGGGYVPIGLERLDPTATNTVELKEALNIRFTPQTDAPASPTTMQRDIGRFKAHLDQLADKIFRLLAISLSIDAQHFSAAHQPSRQSSTTLRLLHYLPVEGTDGTTIRAGRHSDYGSLTLLFQQAVGGLQVVDPTTAAYSNDDDDDNGLTPQLKYLQVPVVEGRVIVNVGDLMQIWTDGYFHSAQHRVIDAGMGGMHRYSVAYFIHPADDLVITSPPLQLNETLPLSRQKQIERKRMHSLLDGLPQPFTAAQYLKHRLGVSYN